MVEKRHGKRKYKEGKIFQQKIKNNINEMTELYFFWQHINVCSSTPNRFQFERNHQ